MLNVITTGDMERAKIPATMDNDEQLVERVAERFGSERWMFIPNTLHLNELYVSEDLREEVAANPICKVDEQPVELSFTNGRHQLTFDS